MGDGRVVFRIASIAPLLAAALAAGAETVECPVEAPAQLGNHERRDQDPHFDFFVGGLDLELFLGKLGNSLLCRTLRDLGFSGRGMPTQLGRTDQPDGGHFLKTALFTQGMAIAGGTDEIQRNLIGERELGLPKEPDPTRGVPFNELPN